MKKLNIFLISALALAAVACDDKSDLGVIQTNEPETLMTVDGITIQPATEYNAPAINLANYDASDIIPMLTYETDPTIPADAKVSFNLEVSPTSDYKEVIDIPMVDIENQTNACGVTAESLDGAFRALLGKTPNAHDMYARISAFINIGTQVSRLGDLNTWLGTPAHAIMVTPVDLGINTEAEYYLYGSACGNVMANAIKMNHSDLNQWDDTVWNIAFEVPADGQVFTWAVAPLSVKEANSTDNMYGVDGNDHAAQEGTLALNGAAGEITAPGKYLLTVDMQALTYKVAYALDGVWTPGNGNGWGFGSGMLSTDNFVNYSGYSHLSGEFKMTGQPDWSPLEFASAGAVTKGTNKDTGYTEYTGSAAYSGGNMGPVDNSLYWVDFNVSTLEYTLTQITGIGIIGGFSDDNNWASDYVTLTPSEDFLTWTGEVTFPSNEVQYKFRMNGGWNYNLGGNAADPNQEYTDLVPGGANLLPPGVGTYTVELKLTRAAIGDTYQVVFTAK